MTEQSMHWADQSARRIIKEKGDKKKYVVEAGITPSGTVHIGNFREIITQELVQRAIKDLGKDCDFLYVWDDYDVFRKVPKNMPNKELLKTLLRKPITEVPDTFDCKHSSYARHNEEPVENIILKVGIKAIFLYQHEEYKSCKFAEQIKQALEKTNEIKVILDKHRKDPLKEEWLPVSVFCDKCGTDMITKIEYEGDYNLYYECKCSHKEEFDFRKKGIVKLAWRVDWPMRWYFNKVDFESAGKDHFASGGSWDTCKGIIKKVWNDKGPEGFMYEWISIKGGKQFSSSSGVVTTLQDVLDVYEPEIVRYLFASTRPDAEFAISFDLDVLKIYEDFDKCERIYYKKEEVEKKEYDKQKRIYELSCVDNVSKNMPFQPSFRHLCNVVQIYENDFEKIKESYGVKDADVERLKKRAECAYNWLGKYALEDMRFHIQEKANIKIEGKEKEACEKLLNYLNKHDKLDEKLLYEEFYNISKSVELSTKEFFKVCYKILINKERGPRLAPFIVTIGKERVVNLLAQSVE
ncbi:MAG: lysine--tRNA ligase [Nanoarchaeota archaeon]|nr:lysine--tRNA ligase [Nanoarchaeota archaeon]